MLTLQFWFGFISAIALMAVGTIVLSMVSWRRQERKREQVVVITPNDADFINGHPLTKADLAFLEEQWRRYYSRMAQSIGKKGLH